MSEKAPRARRHDPDRKGRIIDVTLEIIAEMGVEGVTHRRVAQKADVSLGSMTYHFQGMEDLLEQAFSRYSRSVSERYVAKLGDARTPAEAREGVADYIFDPLWNEPGNISLLAELYGYTSRSEAMRHRVSGWLTAGRLLLETHFDKATATTVDGIMDGLVLQRAIDPSLLTRVQVIEMLERLAPDSATPASTS